MPNAVRTCRSTLFFRSAGNSIVPVLVFTNIINSSGSETESKTVITFLFNRMFRVSLYIASCNFYMRMFVWRFNLTKIRLAIHINFVPMFNSQLFTAKGPSSLSYLSSIVFARGGAGGGGNKVISVET